MAKRDKYGNHVDFDDNLLCDVTTKGLVGHYAETIVQLMSYALREFYDDKLDSLVSAISTFRTVYVQTYTLSCVIEDICPGLDSLDRAMECIFGEESDEACIVDKFDDLYYMLDPILSENGDIQTQKLLGLKPDLVLDDRLKGLLGLAEGQIGWVERIGTEKSAWAAKARVENIE